MLKISKTSKCIRKASNFSHQKKIHKFDKSNFDKNDFKKELNIVSPKVIKLLENIKKLDENDLKKYNKKFKHIIYTDVKESSAGSKMIAASFIANGYKNIYDEKLKIIDNNEKNTNIFALLCSVQLYGKPFSVKLKKAILSKFNERPDNIYGNNIRYIIIDSGYKEGIDLFDVKYVHIFEPLITNSDEKQVIGRGTRFCGQKGLHFQPNIGWPLHVYKYNLNMSETENTHDLFMDYSGIDIDKLVFSSELEKISKYGAIDYELNININNANNNDLINKIKNPLNGGGIKGKKKKGLNLNVEKAPNKLLKFAEMREYIKERYSKYKWDKIEFKNNCVEEVIKPKAKSFGGKSLPLRDKPPPPSLVGKDKRLISLTNTQDFVSKYFNNTSAYKGLLLWHSVGTGKTCSAIAVASKSFELNDYSILWVTKHTLKSDIWKNMFNQVCSFSVRRKIINNEDIPENINKNYKKYLSKNWFMPISYKQFSNMLSKKNKIYKLMKAINGENDILKKTLVIIDEAHKLYSPDVTASEKANVTIINEKIKHSYNISGKDSVKLLLMTATPYTNDPMHLIKLINLMKPANNLMPENFDDFTLKYLENGKFTEKGKELYLDEISGYISYLNRENDVRNFAYPVFHNIDVNMSVTPEIEILKENIENEENKLNQNTEELETIDSKDKEGKKLLKNNIKVNKTNIKRYNKELKQIYKTALSQDVVIDKCINKK